MMHSAQLRLCDVICALVGVVVLAPLGLVIALFVRWEDGGPIFFRQTRVGQKGRPFTILKFRTMCNAAAGRSITAAGDFRITRTGALLRKFKLDELPQLLNVLKGEMSLIGPRPELPEFVDLTNPYWQSVLEQRPGITDLASLTYRNEEEVLGAAADPVEHYREVILPEKLRLNLLYVKSRTWSSDLKLLWLSISFSLFPERFDRAAIEKSFSEGLRTS
jgi:lipopolysaccharide/colanic/teichoic acid biosynthesis glycosyltransferase